MIRMADGIISIADGDHGRRDPKRSRSSTASIRAISCCSATAAADRCTPARWRMNCRSRRWSFRRSPGISRPSACCSPTRGSIPRRPSSACSTTRPCRQMAEIYRAMESEACGLADDGIRHRRRILRAPRRDALPRPATQHQSADLGSERSSKRSARPSTATTSDATATPTPRRRRNFKRCICPRSRRLTQPDIARLPRAAAKTRAASETQSLFRKRGWLGGRPNLSPGRLGAGFSAAGPAVIEEYGSTTVVWPEDRFEVGDLREIRLQCAAK